MVKGFGPRYGPLEQFFGLPPLNLADMGQERTLTFEEALQDIVTLQHHGMISMSPLMDLSDAKVSKLFMIYISKSLIRLRHSGPSTKKR